MMWIARTMPPPPQCGAPFKRTNPPLRVLSEVLATIGTAVALLGELFLRIGHVGVRAAYRLDGQQQMVDDEWSDQ